jgi:hypothetical protein
MGPLSLVLEGALIILLGACLYYCWRLEQRLNRLREGQDNMRAAAEELTHAVRHAERAVDGLKASAREAGRDLQARIDDARALADRLGLEGGRIRSSADIQRTPRSGGY